MNFAIEDSPEQSAFRAEVREFLARNVSPNLEHSVDPCDMSYEQYSIRRDIGRKLGSKGWQRLHEIPFAAQRGYHAVLAASDDGPKLSVKGAPEAKPGAGADHPLLHGVSQVVDPGGLDDSALLDVAAEPAEVAVGDASDGPGDGAVAFADVKFGRQLDLLQLGEPGRPAWRFGALFGFGVIGVLALVPMIAPTCMKAPRSEKTRVRP